MDQPWQIEMLGWLRVVQADRIVSRFRTRKAGALLAYLAYHSRRSHPREQLIELLWPGSVPAAGRCNLRTELTSLRHQLEPPGVPTGAVLVATRAAVQLNPAACITDVARFEAALQAAKRAANREERAEQLRTAAELYRGELLPGSFEDWILPERQRLEEAFLQALHELVELLEQLGDVPGAVQWARRAVAADPLGEEHHHRLIRLLLSNGQVEAARAQYEQGQEMLLRELGEGLSPEIRALIVDLAPSKERRPSAPAGRRGQRHPSSSQSGGPELPPAGPVASPVVDEGAGTIPPGQPSGAATRRSDNLPLRFTRFFGREREIAALAVLLQGEERPSSRKRETSENAKERLPDKDGFAYSLVSRFRDGESFAFPARLVTLTGPGGTGKTRLALQAAQRLRDAYPGGVWFVSLRDLTDPALIPDQMLLVLRLPRTPHREALEQVVAFLSATAGGARPSLLLLDNFEHLVEGGAETVQKLLEQVEHLTVLVTSRQRLGLEGEREFPVAPLPVPEQALGSGLWALGRDTDKRPRASLRGDSEPRAQSPEPRAVLCYPSVQLFVDRAQAVRPDFQVTAHNAATVADLCRRLEGLPLAIELAAARAGVLTPRQMLARLEQRFELLVGRQRAADPRHRSLRATLDWSYRLLSPELQRFFARLSIFRGGWTVAAAETVCQRPGALEYLEQLREASLVQATETAGEMRFHLLETLREYGIEQLAEEERGALARRHAQFFLGVAETQPGQGLWLDRAEREQDNLRAALDWSVESGEAELGLRLGSALEGFWKSRGDPREGREQLGRLLALPGAAGAGAERARGLIASGGLAYLQGELEAAQALCEESLAIWRRLEDRAGIARVLLRLGWIAYDRGDWKTVRARAEESLAICRELDDPRRIASALTLLAEACRFEGDPTAARALHEEVLAIGRELGDREMIMSQLENLGVTVMEEGDLEAAQAALEESLALAQELGERRAMAQALIGLGGVAYWQEEYPVARAFYEQCVPLWREMGHKRELITALAHLGLILRYQGDLPSAYTLLEEALALARESNVSRWVRWSLAHLSFCAADLGRWEEAAARCAESLRPRNPVEADDRRPVPWGLMGMARVALARGRPARAARLLGAAEALWAASSRPRWPNEVADCDRLVSATRAQLEEAEFAAAWAEGHTIPVERVIAEALQEAPDG